MVSVVILRNEVQDDHFLWVKACESHNDILDFRIVNLTKNNWFEEIHKKKFDIMLAKPGGLTAPYKQLYDERIYILGKVLGYKIFPSPEEIFIYENKRFLSFWLKANNIPHPVTYIFYEKKEAQTFIKNSDYPLVAKTNIGASGSGVKVLYDFKEAHKYIDRGFSKEGVSKRSGPNFAKGDWINRGLHYVLNPKDITKKRSIYKSKRLDRQKGYVILQEYIQHEYEWRVVRIGDSFFAHKKLRKGEKASGALIKGYNNPPFALLDFVKQVTDKHKFLSQAVDVFETERGYLVNEMQCIFGQSDPYQMLVDGIPGRYIYLNYVWMFEEGDFTSNQCYSLRLEYVLSRFK